MYFYIAINTPFGISVSTIKFLLFFFFIRNRIIYHVFHVSPIKKNRCKNFTAIYTKKVNKMKIEINANTTISRKLYDMIFDNLKRDISCFGGVNDHLYRKKIFFQLLKHSK